MNKMEKLPHFYLSTACHHNRHSECRLQCKFCEAKCCCECHAIEVKRADCRNPYCPVGCPSSHCVEFES
jgi:hypothetical protein